MACTTWLQNPGSLWDVKISDTFKKYDKVLVKVSEVMYISVNRYQKLFIFVPYTLEDWHSYHYSRPQGPCPWMGLEVKISDIFKKYDKVLVKVSEGVYISVTTYQKLFIFVPYTLEDWHLYHYSRLQSPCPWLGLEVKISDTFKKYDKVLVKVSEVMHISVNRYQKLLIFVP